MSKLLSVATAPSWRDLLTLCKPRVVLLMLLTAAVGMCLAVDGPPPAGALVAGLSGIALVRGLDGAPMRAFRYSIIYLGLLFLALLVDHYAMAVIRA